MNKKKQLIHLMMISFIVLFSLFSPFSNDFDSSYNGSNDYAIGTSDEVNKDHSSSSFDLASLFQSATATAKPKGEDWIEMGKSRGRERAVTDEELRPLIMFKAKMKLGWSTSQVLAVGDYFYVLAAIPSSAAGNGNFFKLNEGTYFYKIPVDFKFKKGLTNAQLRDDIISKGGTAVRIRTYTKNYSHPTYNPANKTFYIGVGQNVYTVNETTMRKGSQYYATSARITSSPTIVGNDIVTVSGSTSTTGAGGRIYVIKGLAAGNAWATYYQASQNQKAEVASAAAINSTDFSVGLNFRSLGLEGKVLRFSTIDKGNTYPALSRQWIFTTKVGVAASVSYYDHSVFAATKYGRLYKINAATGKKQWHTDISGVSLINNSPAIDGTYYYQPVRSPGKVVKVRISDGQKMWTASQGSQVSGAKVDPDISTGEDVGNDTTYWKTPKGTDIVFYGDTGGAITFLTTSGNRIDVALDKTTNTIKRSSLKGNYEEDGVGWEYQGNGAATEMMLGKNHLIFGANVDADMGETWFYSVGIADDVYVKSIDGGDYQAGTRAMTKVVVGNQEWTSGMRVPVVRFYVDGKLTGEKRIDLDAGDEKDVYFMWTVPDNKKKGVLTATINIPPEFSETDMTNNIKEADYTVREGYNFCTPEELNDTAIVKTFVQEDSEGNKYTVHRYEYLTTLVDGNEPTKLRAGYGFKFNTHTYYLDETSEFTGPKNAKSVFPDSPNYVDPEVELEKSNIKGPSYDETADWLLPKIFVEYYSGNVFYDKNHEAIDNADKFVVPNGERRWYTDFFTPDGPYIFKSVARNAGKNNLTSCYTSYVTIKGTPFNDYVRRSVLPDTPFIDGEIGFNWKNDTGKITSLKSFYYSNNSNGDGQSSYVLSNESIDSIKGSGVETISKESTDYFFSSY